MGVLLKFYLLVLCQFLDETECSMSSLVHEGMITEIYEKQQAPCRPNITFIRIFLIPKLLRRGINGCPLIQRMILNLRYFSFIHTLRTPEIRYLDDHPFANEYIFWLKIAVEDSLDIHHYKCLHDLPEKPDDFRDG